MVEIVNDVAKTGEVVKKVSRTRKKPVAASKTTEIENISARTTNAVQKDSNAVVISDNKNGSDVDDNPHSGDRKITNKITPTKLHSKQVIKSTKETKLKSINDVVDNLLMDDKSNAVKRVKSVNVQKTDKKEEASKSTHNLRNISSNGKFKKKTAVAKKVISVTNSNNDILALNKSKTKSINSVLDDLLDDVKEDPNVKKENFDKVLSSSFNDNILRVAQSTALYPDKGQSVDDYIENSKDYYRLLLAKLKVLVDNFDVALYSRVQVIGAIKKLIEQRELEIFKVCNGYVLIEKDVSRIVEGTVEFSCEYHKIPKLAGEDSYTYKTDFVDELGKHYSLFSTEKTLFHGDLVRGILNTKINMVYYQETVKEHNLILGRIIKHNDGYNLVPDDPKFGKFKFRFSKQSLIGDATLGSIVICSILKRGKDSVFNVAVEEILGDFERLDVQIKMAITKNGIPYEWNTKVEKQINKIPSDVLEKDLVGRIDLRKLPLVTIDGEDARDFDDAVYCDKVGTGYKLYVAIADVSYYVRPTTPLDNEAIMRGTSVYFPNYVVPMLPEKLSNGLCSLNPFVDRLCMECKVDIDKNGELGAYKFYPAVMNSHARLTYTEVASVLAGNKPDSPEVESLIGDLNNLYALFKALKKARNKRGAIEFESEEVRFVFDENLNISDVLPVARNEAHMLIEECMIAANVCAAKFVEEQKGATLYRVHDRPSDLKLQSFRSFLAPFGLTLDGGEKPTSADYAKFALEVKDNPNSKALLMMMLRSMSLAQYTPENSGHFGLALGNYAHFTSPIRRYPDLQLHREIKYLLGKNNEFSAKDMKNIGAKQYLDEELDNLAESCNNTERRADKVTGEVSAVLKAKFMEKFVGQALSGMISNVTDFGLFVSIGRFHIDGMVHIANLGNDFFNFDAEKCALVGDRTHFVFKVGDAIDVIIDSVDTETGHINMSPCNLPTKLMNSKNKKSTISVEPNYTPTEAISNNDVNSIIRVAMDKWDAVVNNEISKKDVTKEGKKKKSKVKEKNTLLKSKKNDKKKKKKKSNAKKDFGLMNTKE